MQQNYFGNSLNDAMRAGQEIVKILCSAMDRTLILPPEPVTARKDHQSKACKCIKVIYSLVCGLPQEYIHNSYAE